MPTENDEKEYWKKIVVNSELRNEIMNYDIYLNFIKTMMFSIMVQNDDVEFEYDLFPEDYFTIMGINTIYRELITMKG